MLFSGGLYDKPFLLNLSAYISMALFLTSTKYSSLDKLVKDNCNFFLGFLLKVIFHYICFNGNHSLILSVVVNPFCN